MAPDPARKFLVQSALNSLPCMSSEQTLSIVKMLLKDYGVDYMHQYLAVTKGPNRGRPLPTFRKRKVTPRTSYGLRTSLLEPFVEGFVNDYGMEAIERYLKAVHRADGGRKDLPDLPPRYSSVFRV